MPLTANEDLPDRQMGLRHRAALGISEVSDAVAVVVSEETGIISVVHNGRMIRRLDMARLKHVLSVFYHRPQRTNPPDPSVHTNFLMSSPIPPSAAGGNRGAHGVGRVFAPQRQSASAWPKCKARRAALYSGMRRPTQRRSWAKITRDWRCPMRATLELEGLNR